MAKAYGVVAGPVVREPADVARAGRMAAPSAAYDRLRRVFDCVVAAAGLVILAPLLLLLAGAIVLDSPGPPGYRQRRVGRDGCSFEILKLRTMKHGAEGDGQAVWAQRADSRVTRVGVVLRRSHFDELPQLWNVLRGDMSLIGPRPERPEFIPTLARAIPRYCERLTVRPGVTGLAQVQLPPDSDLNSVRRKLAYDLYYTQHQGLWLDLRLLLATAGKVLGIPFRWTRMILRLPSGPAIENAARNQDKTTPPTPQLTLVLQ